MKRWSKICTTSVKWTANSEEWANTKSSFEIEYLSHPYRSKLGASIMANNKGWLGEGNCPIPSYPSQPIPHTPRAGNGLRSTNGWLAIRLCLPQELTSGSWVSKGFPTDRWLGCLRDWAGRDWGNKCRDVWYWSVSTFILCQALFFEENHTTRELRVAGQILTAIVRKAKCWDACIFGTHTPAAVLP